MVSNFESISISQKMTDPRSGFSRNLILYELRKTHDALTKTKEEHTLNFRMIKPTEKFNFGEPFFTHQN